MNINRLLFWTLSCLYGEGTVIAKHCSSGLGMESGKIKNEQLSASSSFDWKVVGPQNSRQLLIFNIVLNITILKLILWIDAVIFKTLHTI